MTLPGIDGEHRRTLNMKQTECPNCGAVFDAKETRCPYCSYINPEGAEAKYLKDLEDSRRNLDAVDDQVRSGYRKEIRKGAGTALKTVLIIALILAVVIGGFIYAEHRLYDDDREDYAAELAWEHQRFPQYDGMLAAGEYEALMSAIAEEGEAHDVWNWEHYDEFMEIADGLWGDEP
jgi:hypothetical protein